MNMLFGRTGQSKLFVFLVPRRALGVLVPVALGLGVSRCLVVVGGMFLKRQISRYVGIISGPVQSPL